MEKIKISILIPVYNTGKFLEKCLESVVNQNLKEIEIICVNDGSIDNSLEILQNFAQKDKRIIIIDKENGGLTTARNAALKIAKGKYCLNIDSDDWIEQGYFEAMYERAEKDNLDIVISDIKKWDEKKDEIEEIKDLDIGNNDIIDNYTYLKELYTTNFLNYTWNKLIKRELYIKNQIFYDENIFLLEDAEVLGRLIYFAKRIGKVNKSFYYYRIGNNNSSGKIVFKNLTDVLECYEHLEKFFIDKKEFELKNMISKIKNIDIISSILKGYYSNYKEYPAFINKYLKIIKKDKYMSLNDILKAKKKKYLLRYNLIKLFQNKQLIKILSKKRNKRI